MTCDQEEVHPRCLPNKKLKEKKLLKTRKTIKVLLTINFFISTSMMIEISKPLDDVAGCHPGIDAVTIAVGNFRPSNFG